MAESYQSIAARKREQRDSLIPLEWRLSSLPPPSSLHVTSVPRESGILSGREIHITEDYDAVALAAAIARREFSCVEVATAFCKRAAIAQQVTNCLTEPLFASALDRASSLDQHLARNHPPFGPLYGVPISLKDTFNLPGVDSSIGLASLCFHPSTTTSPLAALLLSAGAVIHCKTNIPQTLMALDSTNNIFGRVLNPLNRQLTAGGSSGGEGALLAMRGSALGVGTDIGGSIRIPAACNGLYGLNPSDGRVPFGGQTMGATPGMSRLSLSARAGPIARSVRDCKLFLDVVEAARPWKWDPHVVPSLPAPRPPRETAPRRRLRIGVLETDNVTTPLPPVAQTLRLAAAALSRAGHSVHALPPPRSFPALQGLANGFFGLDGGGTMRELLARHGEPLIPWLAPRLKFREPRSLGEAAELHRRRDEVREEMMRELWRARGRGGREEEGEEFDVILCPVAPHPTPPIDMWGTVNYTSAWVLLDYCAGVVPVRKFEMGDVRAEFGGPIFGSVGSVGSRGERPERDQTGEGHERDRSGEKLERNQPGEGPKSKGRWDDMNRRLWDPSVREKYVCSVMGVQVVAPRLMEGRLLEGMEAVDEAVRGWMGRGVGETVVGIRVGGAKL